MNAKFAQIRLTLAVMLPITSLVALNALSRTSTAQELPRLEKMAVQQVSELNSIPLDDLRVIKSAEVNLPFIGEKVVKFKVLNKQDGEIYGVNLDSTGKQVSSTELEQEERSGHNAVYGKLHPALAAKLADASQNAKVKVIVWMQEPDQPEALRSDDKESSRSLTSEAEANAFLEQVQIERADFLKDVVAPVAKRARQFDTSLRTGRYSPVIYARLTPDAIREIGTWPEVLQVYEDNVNYPELEIALPTIDAGFVHASGITGNGVGVAQIEVGGRVATNNPFLSGIAPDTTYVCKSVSGHSTGVAGIIRSSHSTRLGIAPNVSLLTSGSCKGIDSELQNRSTAAADWGARALNLSWGRDTNLVPGANDRFYDDMVINRFRTVVKSAGNQGGGDNDVTSPGLAYNVITVGNFDDRNTANWSDDVMNSTSSWGDPKSTNGDREKPELAAPGTSINSTTTSSPWTGAIGSGTSYAAPMVTGVAALLMQRHPSLEVWPEGVKAILMTTAAHNIEGSSRLSEKDGAGGIFAPRAEDVAGSRQSTGGFGWDAQSYTCDTEPTLDVATMYFFAGERPRATIVWDQNPNYPAYASQPSADLDLEVIDPSGSVVAFSSSWDNTYEIVDFTASTSGNYKLRVVKREGCGFSDT